MTLSQERILATEIPGPRSQALQARKLAAVSAGVGTTSCSRSSRRRGESSSGARAGELVSGSAVDL